jgi:hypothetical protein
MSGCAWHARAGNTARQRRGSSDSSERLLRRRRHLLMTVPSAEEVSKALQLALRVVEARGNRPIDPRSRRAVLP